MSVKFVHIIKKIVKSPELTKTFLECKGLDEMHLFLQQFGENFTTEELKNLINELNTIMRSNIELVDSKLDLVAGGKNANIKKIASTSLACLSLLNLVWNNASAVNSNVVEAVSMDKNKQTDTSKNKTSMKKIAAYLGGAFAVVAVPSLIYFGYRYNESIKFPIIFATKKDDDLNEELQETIEKHKTKRKNFILITRPLYNQSVDSSHKSKFKIEHFTYKNNFPEETFVDKHSIYKILMDTFAGGYLPACTVKSGLYSGNEEAFNQILALPSI